MGGKGKEGEERGGSKARGHKREGSGEGEKGRSMIELSWGGVNC
jgi:hypothetical protein